MSPLQRLANRAVLAAWRRLDRVGEIVPGTGAAQEFGALGEGSCIAFPAATLMNVGSIHIGALTLIGRQVTLSVGYGPGQADLPERGLVIGDRCVLGARTSLTAHTSVEVGDDHRTGFRRNFRVRVWFDTRRVRRVRRVQSDVGQQVVRHVRLDLEACRDRVAEADHPGVGERPGIDDGALVQQDQFGRTGAEVDQGVEARVVAKSRASAAAAARSSRRLASNLRAACHRSPGSTSWIPASDLSSLVAYVA